jgi:hypothetical protein
MMRSSFMPRASQALLLYLFLLSHCIVASNAATLLRTGEVSAAPGDWHSSTWWVGLAGWAGGVRGLGSACPTCPATASRPRLAPARQPAPANI